MSNSVSNLATFRYVDPLLDIEQPTSFVFKEGCSNLNIRRILSTQSSESNITFNYLPPSSRTLISRDIKTDITFRFTFRSDTDNGELCPFGSLASFRDLNYGVTVGNLSIDNSSTSENLSETWGLRHRFYSTEFINKNLVGFGCPDLMHSFDLPLVEGFAYNVNKNFAESDFGDDVLRGRYVRSLIKEVIPAQGYNPNLERVFDVQFISCIPLDPLTVENNYHLKKSLFGVETLTYILTMQRNLQDYVYAQAPSAPPLTSIDYTLQSAYLLVGEYQMPATIPLPATNLIAYDYTKNYSQVTRGPSVPSGASSSILSNNNQTAGTPTQIMFYIRDKNVSYLTPKTALRITKISVVLDTKILFEQMSPVQLYTVNKANGYNGQFEDWYNYSGSYFRLVTTEQLPLDIGDSPSRLVKKQLSLEIQFENQTDRTIDPELVLMISYSGVMNKGFSYASYEQNILSARDVLESKNLPEMPREVVAMNKMYGGISFSEVFSKGKQAYNVAKNCAPALKNVYDQCGDDVIQLIRGKKGKGVTGGKVMGGKVASRSSMKNRLTNY